MECMASTRGTTLCCLMSMCWIGEVRSSFFVGIAYQGYQSELWRWLISARNEWQEGHQQAGQLRLHARSRLHHFLVVNRLIEDAGRHVGNAGNPEHFDAHMAGNNHLLHGR